MIKKNSRLPAVKISSELHQKINSVLEMLNDNSMGIELRLPEFRRMAYKFFCEDVIKNGLDLSIKGKYE